jgi:hypothetical protein
MRLIIGAVLCLIATACEEKLGSSADLNGCYYVDGNTKSRVPVVEIKDGYVLSNRIVISRVESISDIDSTSTSVALVNGIGFYRAADGVVVTKGGSINYLMAYKSYYHTVIQTGDERANKLIKGTCGGKKTSTV